MTPRPTPTPAPAAASASAWFVRPPAADAPARIFCFPFSGSGASAFSAWPAALGGAEVCPVQFPGRENRLGEPHYGTYEALAENLADALEPLLETPYAFFGHCAGALPAFETVLRLADRGLPVPRRLFVSGQPAPHDAWRDPMLTWSEPQLRAEIETFLRGRGIEPRPDITEVGLSVLLRDHAAAGAYRRTAPAALPCPVTAVHWSRDPDVTAEDLAGWRRYAPAVDIRVLDGGHYDFMDAPGGLRALLTGWR